MCVILKSIIQVYKDNTYLLITTIISLLIIVIGYFLYNKFRGFMGEFWLKKELNKLPKKEYLVLDNIMIMNKDVTYQIDHIVISRYGIFVIEMKNYFGYIYGNEYKKYWYQYFKGYKRMFYNPIYQNYGHVKALANTLNLNEDIFIPVVCFSNQVKLKINIKKNIITVLDDIKNVIKTYQTIIIKEDIYKIRENILKLNIIDRKIRRKHVHSIKSKLNE